MNNLEHIKEMGTEAAGNHLKFESFGGMRDLDDGDQWAVVYTVNRDSGLLEQSNGAVIDEALAAYAGGEDCKGLRHGHWGVGWIEGYAIRVFKPGTKEPTDAWIAFAELAIALEDYGCLDDSDLSSREHEALLESIADRLGRYETEVGASDVARWLWDNEQRECDSIDGRGAYPSDESIRRALEFLDPDAVAED